MLAYSESIVDLLRNHTSMFRIILFTLALIQITRYTVYATSSIASAGDDDDEQEWSRRLGLLSEAYVISKLTVFLLIIAKLFSCFTTLAAKQKTIG